jgi:DNA-binding MarR family transcriptional regulator
LPEPLQFNFDDINKLQTTIMQFVDSWARSVKTPVPQKEIVAHLRTVGVKDYTVVNALNTLLQKGYIRRSVSISNRTSYVQLRGIRATM